MCTVTVPSAKNGIIFQELLTFVADIQKDILKESSSWMGNYRNDIIFQELLTLVADIEKQHILYRKNRLYVWEIIGIFFVCVYERSWSSSLSLKDVCLGPKQSWPIKLTYFESLSPGGNYRFLWFWYLSLKMSPMCWGLTCNKLKHWKLVVRVLNHHLPSSWCNLKVWAWGQLQNLVILVSI